MRRMTSRLPEDDPKPEKPESMIPPNAKLQNRTKSEKREPKGYENAINAWKKRTAQETKEQGSGSTI